MLDAAARAAQEFLGSSVAYTYSAHDGRSAVLDPTTKAAVAPLGNVALLSQAHEISLIQRVRDHGGPMVFNGQPRTRTTRSFAAEGNGGSRVAGGAGGASLHFVEDSEEARMRFTHLFTPIALLRYGGQRKDLDPRYNDTCPAPLTLTQCIGRNIYDHLDYAVLPYLYDGLLPNTTSPTVVARMFPTTPIELRPGTLRARERTITKHPGTLPAPPDAHGGAWAVYVYKWAELVGDGRPNATGTGDTATVGPLGDGEIAIVVPAE